MKEMGGIHTTRWKDFCNQDMESVVLYNEEDVGPIGHDKVEE